MWGRSWLPALVHQLSPRRALGSAMPNCAALPEELLGSELFGRAWSILPAPSSTAPVCLKEADGGTLRSTRVAETFRRRAQAKLLRAVQQREVRRRVGVIQSQDLTMRVVAAASRDMRAGGRRRDAFRRRTCSIASTSSGVRIPPLRT